MSNYSVLKQDINNNIYENQTQQITGTVLNAILNEMTASLGAGYQFAGVATLGMNPGDPDQRVFYLAGEGIYTNFGGLQVPAGKLGVLKWDNRWTLQTIDGLGGGGANLTGYVSVASTDDLPEEGQPTLGYLCGTNLYLYVGEGGDTKEGKYQDCGSFRGPEGAYIQDIEQTETSHENGGRNTIKMTLSDGRSFNAYVHNGTTSSGLFPTVEALQAAYPNPVVGQYAFVGAGFPADIYVCTTAGTWTDSGEDYDGDNVDLTDYATKAEVNQLEAKVDGFDTQNYTEGLILKSNGTTESVEGWGISDFIPYTSGGHITWNYGGPKRTSACLLFYNDAKEFISGAYWPASNDSGELSIPYTDINTYAPNAAFIRASYRTGNANAAVYRFSVEIWKPQDIHTPGLTSRMSSVEQDVSEMQGKVVQIDSLAQIIPNKLDKVMGTNLVNPDEILSGAALPWNGTDPYTGLDQKYKVSGYIPVNEKNIISNAYSADETWATMYVYDADKNFLRNNGTNQQYTYQEGDAFVRISFNSTNVKNWKANYGTTLADYAPYTDYKPLQDLDVRVTAIEDKIGTVDYDYTTVALFKSIAVVGDSYSSGAIYGVSGAVEGRHDGMAWLNIMARRNGIQSTGLYATPSQNTTKFLDPTDSRYNSYGLGALLSDTAKDLYFIMLGINAEPDGVGVGTVEDCNVDWTQNATSFCGNIGKIIGNIKTHAPKAKIVCIVANMLFSNLNPATNSEKRAAIIAAAEFYGVAWMEAADNPFFSSTFYVSQLHTNHPVGTTYAGMAVAFEKLFSACVQGNPSYFADYANDNS